MKFSKIALGILLTLGVYAHAEKVDVNFKNLEIGDFIKMVGKITGKNILVDGDIKGKINFVSNKPIEKSELIPLANAILETKKMTLVDKGEYYQVVKSPEAAASGLEVREETIGEGGTMRTVVFQLNNVNAAVIRTKIKPLLHKSAKIISFKKNNLLAVTAYPYALKSVKELIDKIENKQGSTSEIVPLENAYVKDVYPIIQSMAKSLFPQDISSEKVNVLQDPSSNSLVLVGSAKNIEKLKRYIQELDVERQRTDDMQRMYVIPLMNSNVEEMEKILAKLLPQMTGIMGVEGGIHAVGDVAKPKVSAPASSTTKGSRVPLPNNKKIKKAVIASDVERNALIVLANKAQIQNIRETIRLLDIEKAQVYIQAKIVEVNTNLAENIGMKYGFNGGSITSNGIFSLMSSSGAAPLAISGDLMSFLNQGGTTTIYNDAGNPIGTETTSAFSFDPGIKDVFSLGVQLDLLKQNGAAQVLSEPSILTTNNKEATIYVGQTQSILVQSQQSAQGSSNILNNYSREDIGITLTVKPRLSSDNKVNLQVETTIEDILPGSGGSADRPTTTKRSVKTNAIVDHGETIILGGLIKSSTGTGSTKIPILGDIPILGRLFTSQNDSKSKINVVIYLTPYIVKKSTDLRKLRKYLDELDSIQEQFNRIVLNKLEQRRMGMEQDRTHVTFESRSKDQEIITPEMTEVSYEQPVRYQQVQESTSGFPEPSFINSDDSYVVEEIYDQEVDPMHSESILEHIQPTNRSIDLDQINTGIEYNENTTFTN